MRLSSFAAAVLCVSSLAAHADTLSQTITFGPGLTDFRSTTGAPLLLNYFNSNLGVLNSISFNYSYSFTSVITVTNTSTGESAGTVKTQSGAQFGSNDAAITQVLDKTVNAYVDPVDGNTVEFGESLSPIAADVRGPLFSFNLAPGASTSATGSGGFISSTITDSNASDLAAFSEAGGGSFIPLLNTVTGVIDNISFGNTSATQSTIATGELSVSYNYVPDATSTSVTPEPSSFALLGTGLLGIAGAIRKRIAS